MAVPFQDDFEVPRVDVKEVDTSFPCDSGTFGVGVKHLGEERVGAVGESGSGGQK